VSVAGGEHRGGVGQRRVRVAAALVRVVGGGPGVNVGAGERESLCGGVDVARAGDWLGDAGGVVIAYGPRVGGGGGGHGCSLGARV
jgi:hypothetical protein